MADGLDGRAEPGPQISSAHGATAPVEAVATAAAPSVPAQVSSGSQTPLPVARALPGEHQIARVLRMGAVLAGLCFLASIALELLPPSTRQAQAIDLFREGGAMLLIMTPITRLIAAGVMLGLRGEWRYALYAGVILALVSLALGAGLHT